METERIGGEREGDFTRTTLLGVQNSNQCCEVMRTGTNPLLVTRQFFNLITFVLRKIRELVLVLRANSHKFSTSKTKRNTLTKSPVLYLNITTFVKMIFWRKFTTFQHSFSLEGGGVGNKYYQFIDFMYVKIIILMYSIDKEMV